MDLYSALAVSREPWTAYNAMINLLGMESDEERAAASRREMLAHPKVKGLMEDLSNWPGKVTASHKSAGQPYHKLSFLADIGIKADEPGMDVVIERIMESASDEGPFLLPMTISENFGVTGKEAMAWAACDAPITLYALVKMGMGNDPRVMKGVGYMLGLVRENGWGCTVSNELGSFRGPGRKEDPCPYVNLIMLKLLSAYEGLRRSPQADKAAECLLELWERSMDRHPYIFYMGNDFRKLKAPFIWYDLLHVIYALSHHSSAVKDPRFVSMMDVLDAKPHEEGLYKPESIWQAWKDWDFGSIKSSSSWLSYLVALIRKRVAIKGGGPV
ncbi:MAG TPA: hypothetical protein PLT03_01015 [Bacillota bacterium]|nr:hypothetical protein [Bacillota bacterium]HOG52433.1 hypothetical protein [Bacillota bacterium]